jgi:hypothetical protein
MNMPGFNAEPSLYKTSGRYRMSATLEATLNSGAVHSQRIPSPYGPIGLPGQNACEVCWHMCMTFGGNYSGCAQTCAAACGGSTGFGLLRNF